MKTEGDFLTSKIWQRIGAAAKTGIGHAAVAYIGKDAPSLLQLRKGSILVCDASLEAVQNGLTDPSALGEFIKRGVRVYSVGRLHAKVVAFPKIAFVGSMNASTRSATVLQEAAIQSSDPATIAAAKAWVLSSLGEPIGPEYVAEVCKLYNPPKWELNDGVSDKEQFVGDDILWIVRLDGDASSEAEKLHEKTRLRAERMLCCAGDFELDWFEWSAQIPKQLLHSGGHILQIIPQGSKSMVHEPERFLRIELMADVKRCQIVHAEYPADFGRVGLGRLNKLCPELDLESIRFYKLVRYKGIVTRVRKLIRTR
jgi:hypothetical protein